MRQMVGRTVLSILLLSSGITLAQSGSGSTATPQLQVPTTLPILFTKTVSADHSRAGDSVLARTMQSVRLANGTIAPSGTQIVGHVLAANPFVFDKTPYPRQKQSSLTIRFDSLELAGIAVPLKVTVRAIADPITSWDARMPNANDEDMSSPTVAQIGGDQLNPSQSEVLSSEGDVVAYNRRDGVYAHLISNGGCDSSSVEVSVAIFSAAACGIYGFTNVAAQEMGSPDLPSVLTLVSARTDPKIWKNSTALLEVLPDAKPIASR